MRIFNKVIVLAGCFLCMYSQVFGQSTTSSPYSAYAFGSMTPQTIVAQKGMGDVTTAVRFRDQVNISNPASYSALQLTYLDMGISLGWDRMSTTDDELSTVNYAFDYFLAGMRLGENKGLAFGLLPYTNVGYNMNNTDILAGTDTEYRNVMVGSGGYSQAFVGYGMEVYRGLSIGANFGYVFGNVQRNILTEFNDPFAYNSGSLVNTGISSFLFTYGLQYSFSNDDQSIWTIGQSGSLGTKAAMTENAIFHRYLYDGSGNKVPIDTIGSYSQNYTTNLPLTLNAGISYDKPNKLLLALDFQYQDWNNYVSHDKEGLTSVNYQNLYNFRAGVQYIPDFMSSTNYFKRIQYRAGGGFTRSYLNLNDANINDWSLTVGAGIPLITKYEGGLLKTRSVLNLAIESGSRGTRKNELVKEYYTTIYLGLSFGDRWFAKRRFN